MIDMIDMIDTDKRFAFLFFDTFEIKTDYSGTEELIVLIQIFRPLQIINKTDYSYIKFARMGF